MLSVILYGRNDNHGYNLHKRAAISLNAIAHLLSDPDDEIVFVDYNTPDDLPTFPEAIGDTLTKAAIDRLRILRVRPSVHQERFAARTHLNALEPIARNVAIRRTNPANRWVLSTNTDMIFVPRQDGADLTTAIGGLDDGFYHLPRFELPEGLWETMDRKDPVALIRDAKEWGERFYLNEVILSGGDNVYDGPGDFQLFLRSDLFAIGGFHEEMIRGWHLDANVARRMRMLRGKVSTALDVMIGYHCDHTRQATAYHKADRVENSAAIFVDNIFAPEIRDQAETWGLPDVDIEEVRLGQASGARYLRGLEKAVDGRLNGFLQAEYVPEAYGRLAYQPSHVLPYLLDLVSCIPAGSRIAYVGARRDMLEMFARAWQAMGAEHPVLVPDIAPWFAGAPVETAALDAWMALADVFIFEIGAERSPDQASLDDDERARLWAVDYAFKASVGHDRERQTGGAVPRRALVVNGVHNFFEWQVFAAISVTLTPYSSRVRHGYFIDPARSRLTAAGDADRLAAAQLGALSTFDKSEIDRFMALTAAVKAGDDDGALAEAGRSGAEIEALHAAGLKGLFTGFGRPDAELVEQVTQARPSRAVRAVAPLLAAEAGAAAASRLPRLEDWENPAWLKLARWLFSNRNHDLQRERNRWVWERTTLAQNLFAAFPMESRPKVLLVGALPEGLAFALASLDCEVDIVNPLSLEQGGLQATDWRREFIGEAWMTPAPVGLAGDRAAAIAGGFRYDAVILCQNALLLNGRELAASVLRNAVRHVRVGGHVGLSADVQLIDEDPRERPESLPPELIRDGRFAQALANLVDLRPQGAVDLRMTPRSFDRLAPVEFPTGAPPALAIGAGRHIETTAVFSLTKGQGADGGDWDALAEVIIGGSYAATAPLPDVAAPTPAPAGASAPAGSSASEAKGGRLFTAPEIAGLVPVPGRRLPPRFGPIFDRLVAAEGVTRTPVLIRVPASLGEEVALSADVGVLPPGSYELVVEAQVSRPQGAGEVLAIAVGGDNGLIVEQAESADGPGLLRALVNFDLDGAGAPGGVRLAIKGLGRADIDVLGVVLR